MAEPVDVVAYRDLAAFIHGASVEVHAALFGRLSPKLILRMRAVCKTWRGKLDAWAAWRQRTEPPRPLICFDSVACPSRYTRLRDYCVVSLDLGSHELRSVLRFTDNEGYELDEYDLHGRGRRGAPAIDEFDVDFARMERYGQVDFVAPLLVHGSLDGHLLVSSLHGWYVTNPVTRQRVVVPDLSHLDVVGFYEHPFAGDYRVLFFCPQQPQSQATYGVLSVSTRKLRLIGRPISADAPADHGLALGVDVSYLSPSIQFRNNYTRHLYWPPQQRQGYHILVFNAWSEEFSWKRPPPAMHQDMRLLELPTGHLGLSVSGASSAVLELWRLQDYYNEVWVRMYRIQLSLPLRLVLQEEGVWIAGVMSGEGDVLIQCRRRLFHCDRNGNFLRQFRFHQTQRLFSVRHMLRESLVLHPMFFMALKIPGAAEPCFFHGSD